MLNVVDLASTLGMCDSLHITITLGRPLLISFSLDCTYGVTVKQVGGAQYVAHLERKIQILEQQGVKTPIDSPVSAQDSPLSQCDDYSSS